MKRRARPRRRITTNARRRVPARHPVTGLFLKRASAVRKPKHNPRPARRVARRAVRRVSTIAVKPRRNPRPKLSAKAKAKRANARAFERAAKRYIPVSEKGTLLGGWIPQPMPKNAVEGDRGWVIPLAPRKRPRKTAKGRIVRRPRGVYWQPKRTTKATAKRKSYTRAGYWDMVKNPSRRRRRVSRGRRRSLLMRNPRRRVIRRRHVMRFRRNPGLKDFLTPVALTIGGYALATAAGNYAANYTAKRIAALPVDQQTSGLWGFLGKHGRPIANALLVGAAFMLPKKIKKLAPYETPLILGSSVALFNSLLAAYLTPESKVLPWVASLPAPNAAALGAIDVYEAALSQLQPMQGYGAYTDLQSDEGISRASLNAINALSSYVEEPMGSYVEEQLSGEGGAAEDLGSYVQEGLGSSMFDEYTGELPGMQPEDDLMEALGDDISEATKSAVVAKTAEIAQRAVPATRVAPLAQVGTQVARAVNQAAAQSGVAIPLTQAVKQATTGMLVKAVSRSGERPAISSPVDGAPATMKSIAPATDSDVVFQDGSLYAGQIGGIFRKSMFEGIH